MRRSSSANGTNFEIVREIKWHQYIPIVNVIYDVFFDVPPTVDQLRELINMLLMCSRKQQPSLLHGAVD